jgi:hypothetical protein
MWCSDLYELFGRPKKRRKKAPKTKRVASKPRKKSFRERQRVYFTQDTTIEVIAKRFNNSFVEEENLTIARHILELPWTYSSADGQNYYLHCGPFSICVPRKWVTANPDGHTFDPVMPDTRDYLELI